MMRLPLFDMPDRIVRAMDAAGCAVFAALALFDHSAIWAVSAAACGVLFITNGSARLQAAMRRRVPMLALLFTLRGGARG